MLDEINNQMSELSSVVQVWVNWMMIVFLGSVFFVRRHREARFALLSFTATMILATAIFALRRNVHLFAAAHLICWTPLLIYAVKNWRTSPDVKYKRWSPFRLWLGLLILTITVSIPLDVRDIVLVAMGRK